MSRFTHTQHGQLALACSETHKHTNVSKRTSESVRKPRRRLRLSSKHQKEMVCVCRFVCVFSHTHVLTSSVHSRDSAALHFKENHRGTTVENYMKQDTKLVMGEWMEVGGHGKLSRTMAPQSGNTQNTKNKRKKKKRQQRWPRKDTKHQKHQHTDMKKDTQCNQKQRHSESLPLQSQKTASSLPTCPRKKK